MSATNPHHRQDTAFIGELQQFTDVSGDVPLDDPEVSARIKQQHGRPSGRPQPTLPDAKEPPPAQ